MKEKCRRKLAALLAAVMVLPVSSMTLYAQEADVDSLLQIEEATPENEQDVIVEEAEASETNEAAEKAENVSADETETAIAVDNGVSFVSAVEDITAVEASELEESTTGEDARGDGTDDTLPAAISDDESDETGSEILGYNLDYTFTTTDGESIYTYDQGQDVTVLLFGNVYCPVTQAVLKSISASNWVDESNVRVIFVDVLGHTLEEAITFKEKYCAGSIYCCYAPESDTTAYSNARSALNAYLKYVTVDQRTDANTISWPVTLLIDGENQIWFATGNGGHSEDELYEVFSAFADVSNNLRTPTLTGAENAADGVNVTWNSVSHADGYYIYRKNDEGSWEQIGTSTEASYTDTTPVSGTEYSYTVSAYDESYTSVYDTTGVSVMFLSEPEIAALERLPEGVSITWDSVSGAEGYNVYRCTSGTSWELAGSATTNSYTDSTVENGTRYYYCVGAYFASDSSYYGSTGFGTTWFEAVTMTGLSNTSGGVSIAWEAVDGVDTYYIYRKGSTGSWGLLGSSSTLTYEDASVTSGTTYSYNVLAYLSSSASVGNYESLGMSITYLGAATITALTNTSEGVSIVWDAVNGADGYTVYRMSSTERWREIATTTSTSYIDTDVENGVIYTYSIGTYDSSYSSGQIGSGNSIICYISSSASGTNTGTETNTGTGTEAGSTPETNSGTNTGSESGTGSGTGLETGTNSENGTGSSAEAGTETNAGSGFADDSDAGSSSSAVSLKAAKLTSVKNTASKKITVKWKKQSGVTGYQIQYSTSKKFKKGNKTVNVSGAKKTKKVISKLKKGKTYYVRIRTYKKINGVTYYSAWSGKKKVSVRK